MCPGHACFIIERQKGERSFRERRGGTRRIDAAQELVPDARDGPLVHQREIEQRRRRLVVDALLGLGEVGRRRGRGRRHSRALFRAATTRAFCKVLAGGYFFSVSA